MHLSLSSASIIFLVLDPVGHYLIEISFDLRTTSHKHNIGETGLSQMHEARTRMKCRKYRI